MAPLSLFFGLLILFSGCTTTEIRDSFSAVSSRLGDLAATREPRFSADAMRIDVSNYRRRPPEQRAIDVPEEILASRQSQPQQTIGRLASHLTDGIDDPFLRVKNLHDWIALNIQYDADSFFSGEIPSQDAPSVLQRYTAVCSGYADLFHALSTAAGIRSYTISGYGRGYGSSVFGDNLPTETNHAWNAVLIDGVWYLLDATWNAGYLDNGRFQRRYSTAYLFVQPEVMVYSHFPDVPRHQLIETPISAGDFSSLPYLRGEFFSWGLSVPEDIKRLNEANDRAEVQLIAPQSVRIEGALVASDGTAFDNRVFVERSGDHAIVRATFPAPGRWAIRLFGGNPCSDQGCSLIGEIGFDSSSGTNDIFPTFFGAFQTTNAILVSPTLGPLRVGSRQKFELILPNYVDVFIDAGSRRFPMTNTGGGVFVADVQIPRISEMTVFGRQNSHDRSYQGLVRFPVTAR